MDVLAELDAQAAAAAAWPGVGIVAGEPPSPGGSWSVARALGVIPPPLRRALEEAGATAPGVLRGLCDGSRGDADVVTGTLLPGLGADEHAGMVDALLWLISLAAPEAASRRRRFANLDAGEIIQGVLEGSAAKAARVALDRVEAEARGADASWRPAMRPARFRLRTDARLASASGPAARAEAESAERDKWKAELVSLIREAGGPVVEATRHSAAPELALGAAAGGRRARTLCKRVGAWRRIRAWCLDLYSVPFPRTVLHLIEYTQARADEPCGLSVLQGVAAGFSFMETCCGYPRGERLVDTPLYDAYVKELMASYSGDGVRMPKQAPRYPLAIVLALEREVMDPEVAVCYRCHAWWHLLAVWASLRFDDHRGLPPAAVQFTVRGMEAILERTKTTGPGKRISALPMVVSYGAYLRQPGWLQTGWLLWQGAAPFVRDYFLVKPAAGLNSTLPVEISYEQASRMSRALLSGLPRDDDVMPTMGEPLVGLFTQHSARCWLSSMAALLEIPEADMSYLGRWSPSATKTYVRTATEVVLRIQETVARRLRRDLGGPFEAITGEQAAHLELRRELIKRRFAEIDIEDQMDALQAWTVQLAEDVVTTEPGESIVEPACPTPVLDFEESADAHPKESGVQPVEAPPTPPAEPVSLPFAGPVLPVAPASDGPPTSGFVVSISKSGWRRLHRIGGCTRMPGVHYLNFELLGDEKPGVEAYDDFCRQCWKTWRSRRGLRRGRVGDRG